MRQCRLRPLLDVEDEALAQLYWGTNDDCGVQGPALSHVTHTRIVLGLGYC